MKQVLTDHKWPEADEHVWTPWMQKTSKQPYILYRMCVHPDCPASEEREAPRA